MTYLVTMGTLFGQMERPGRKIRRKLLTTDDLEQVMVMVGDGASLREASSTYKCNELGGRSEVRITQTMNRHNPLMVLYDLICSCFMGIHYNIIPVTTGDFTHTLHNYDVLPEYTKNTRSYTMTYTGHDRRLYS